MDPFLRAVLRYGDVGLDLIWPHLRQVFQQLLGEVSTNSAFRFSTDDWSVGPFAASATQDLIVDGRPRLTEEAIEWLLECLADARVKFPLAQGRSLYGLLGVIWLDPGTLALAEDKGLFVVAFTPMGGTCVNSPQFQAAEF